MGWNLNDSTTSLLPNISFLSWAKWLHSTRMWRTVRLHWQCSQTGGGSFFRMYECVKCVWPMRARHKTTSSWVSNETGIHKVTNRQILFSLHKIGYFTLRTHCVHTVCVIKVTVSQNHISIYQLIQKSWLCQVAYLLVICKQFFLKVALHLMVVFKNFQNNNNFYLWP